MTGRVSHSLRSELQAQSIGSAIGRDRNGQGILAGDRKCVSSDTQLGNFDCTRRRIDKSETGIGSLAYGYCSKLDTGGGGERECSTRCVRHKIGTAAGNGHSQQAAKDRKKRSFGRAVKTTGKSGTLRPASNESRRTLECRCADFFARLGPRQTENVKHLLHLSKCPSNKKPYRSSIRPQNKQVVLLHIERRPLALPQQMSKQQNNAQGLK